MALIKTKNFCSGITNQKVKKGKIMNRWVKVLTASLVIVFYLFPARKALSASTDAAALKALIVNGQNNHGWKTSSPVLKQILDQTGLFKVDIATSPPGSEGMEDFKPDFAAYDVVVLDYNGKPWSESIKAAFVEYVKSGGGVVVYHATSNAFPEWKEYNEIVGLGGWGGRDEKSGPYIRWRDGKVTRNMSPGRGGEHGPQHAFQVVIRDKEHPVTKGLPQKWMHAKDELYAKLRGPAENLTVLATAYSDPEQKGTDEHEPVLFTVNYGKGRVFHTVLGHVGRSSISLPSVECAGFIVTLQRGAEWAATGKVTQKIPEGFPTAIEVRRWKDYRPPRQLNELLAEIATYEFGQSRQPLTELDDLVCSAYDSPQTLKQIEKRFLQFLGSDATPAAKQFICKKLSIIGTEEAVPTLAAMLTEKATSDIEPSDMARYALERIPGPAVDRTLREALGKTSGKVKVGIINSLGQRGDEEAVEQLSKLLTSTDKDIAQAALSALGKIGGREAAKLLGQSRSEVGPQLQLAWADACLMCADKLLAAGDKRSAVRIYRQMYAPRMPWPMRAAGLRGMVTARPERAVRLVVGVLKGEDEQMQAVVIGLLREIAWAEMIEAVTAELPNLSVTGQVRVLSALGDRGDHSALPAVIKGTKVKNEPVRIAALKALGALGGSSEVEVLANTACEPGEVGKTAAESLNQLSQTGVDAAILNYMQKADMKVCVVLIRSLTARQYTKAVPTLLNLAEDRNESIRHESLKALGALATEDALAQMVNLLLKAHDSTERGIAEKAVLVTCRRVEDAGKSTQYLLDALPDASVPARCSLLGLLGRFGGEKALEVVSTAVKDNNKNVRYAAIRSLANWPDAQPAPALIELARSEPEKIHRVLALRGYIRMIGLAKDSSAGQTLAMYEAAMAACERPEEKKLILADIPKVATIEMLKFAEPYLEDRAVKDEAKVAYMALALAIKPEHPKEAAAAINRLEQISERKIPEVKLGEQTMLTPLQGLLTPPTRIVYDGGGMAYMVVPTEGTRLEEPGAEGAGRAVFRFNTAQEGTLVLQFYINCPSNEDDSWHIKLDDNPYFTWNDIITKGWQWKKFPQEYAVEKGKHILIMDQREDGAMMGKIKLTLK